MSNKIILRHNGSIGVESEGYDGSGSTFFFELAAEEKNICKDDHIVHSPHLLKQKFAANSTTRQFISSSKRFRKALVVEESELSRKMMDTVVRNYFTEVITVHNSKMLIVCLTVDFRLAVVWKP